MVEDAEINELLAHYTKYFYATRVTSADLKREVYRLRYDVYCEEFGFENPNNFPARCEVDDYDSFSHHAALIHRASSRIVGCIRLIPKIKGDATCLPVFRYCYQAFDPHALALGELASATSGEISRLSVARSFRRRAEELSHRFPTYTGLRCDDDKRRNFPIIPMSLMCMVIRMAELNEIETLYAMMEPRLYKILSEIGFAFGLMGSFIEYHGRRGPFQLNANTCVSMLPQKSRELYKLIATELDDLGKQRQLKAS